MLDQVANLKVVIEHATTKETVEFVRLREHPGGLGCTITPQHLLFNRNALFIKVSVSESPRCVAGCF